MRGTILIAEDEPFILESLTFLLEREGYGVRSAIDGDTALRDVTTAPPDLLILDTMIPGKDGFEVLSRLRAAPSSEKLPVLVLTAKGQDADRKRMLSLGANEFVTKPFSNKDLLGRIAGLMTPPAPAAARHA